MASELEDAVDFSLPPPSSGRLARLDPALLVTPPKGLEVGFVTIVTRQEAAGGRRPR